MSSRWLAYALLLSAALGAAASCRPLEDLGPAPELRFPAEMATSSEAVSIPDEEGRITLLYFGFTNCPDYCPQTLNKIQRALASLGIRRRHVRVLLISVDPERDTLPRLRVYLDHYQLPAVGLRPDEATLVEATRGFAVDVRRTPLPDSALEYTVDHSTRLFVVDGQGRLRARLPAETGAADLAELLARLTPWL